MIYGPINSSGVTAFIEFHSENGFFLLMHERQPLIINCNVSLKLAIPIYRELNVFPEIGSHFYNKLFWYIFTSCRIDHLIVGLTATTASPMAGYGHGHSFFLKMAGAEF